MGSIKKEVRYKLDDIIVSKFNYNRLLFKSREEVETLPFNFRSSFGYNKKEKVLELIVHVNCKAKDDGNIKEELILFELQTHLFFKFLDDSNFLMGANKVKFPDELIVILTSISISTTRGILYEKIASLDIPKILKIIPVVNPTEIAPIKKNIDKLKSQPGDK